MPLLGTLVVVVFKARNLVNKVRIGKQDVFCSVSINSDKKRTKTIKKGGQAPEWDDELRFEIWQDAADETKAEITATGGVKPVMDNGTARIVKKGPDADKKIMKVAVYSDDPRDPDLIGEGSVDLAETLKKGEFDEWIKIEYKGRYTGEVYIEMTFYSAAPAPAKPKQQAGRRQGDFEPLASSARSKISTSPASTPPSTKSSRPISARLDPADLPPSLRAPSRAGNASVASSQSAHHSTNSSMRHSLSNANLSEWGVLPGQLSQGTGPRDASLGYHAPAELLTSGVGYSQSTSGTGYSQSTTASSYNQPYKRESYPPRDYGSTDSQYGYPRDEIVAALERPLSSLSINKPLPAPAPSPNSQLQQLPPQSQHFAPQASHLQHTPNSSGDWQSRPQSAHEQAYYGPPRDQANPYLQQQSYPQQSQHQTPPHSGYSTPAPQGEYYPPAQYQQPAHPHQQYPDQPCYPYSHPVPPPQQPYTPVSYLPARPLPAPEQPTDQYPQEMYHANSYPGALPQQQPYMPPRSPNPYEREAPIPPPRATSSDYQYSPPQYGYQPSLLPPGTPQPLPVRHSPAPPPAPQPYQYAQPQYYQPQGHFTPEQSNGYYQNEVPVLPPRSPQPYYYQPDSHYMQDAGQAPARPLPVPDSYRPPPQMPPQGWSMQQAREQGLR